MTLVEFLRARLDEDEQWAREASRRRYLPPGVIGVGNPEDYAVHPGGVHWQWVCGFTDEVLTVDPMLGEFLECSDGCVSAELRSVERSPSSNLPQMPLPGSEEVHPPVAGHIARHAPARVLAEVDAMRRIIDIVLKYEEKIDGEWGCCHSASAIGDGNCPEAPSDEIEAFRLLARSYASHPDYDASWGLR